MINIDSRLLGEVDANELYLLCYIANRVGKNGDAWPGNDTLLKETGWHIEKLIRIKKGLEIRGILKVERRTGRANHYSINSKYITNFIDGKSVNGKSVVVGKSDITTTENPASVNTGKSDTDHYGKSDKEVLTIEDVNHTEELDIKRKESFLFFAYRTVFKRLVELFNQPLEDQAQDIQFEKDLKQIEDPTIRAKLKKFWGAAAALYSAYDSLKRPLPGWRHWSGKDRKPYALDDCIHQAESYVEYCRVTGTYMTTDPDKLPAKILDKDWCLAMKNYADERFPDQYDPMENFDACPQWLLEYFYCQQQVWVDKKNDNRIF